MIWVLGNLSLLIRQFLRHKARAVPALTMHLGPESAECAKCHVTAPALVSQSSVTACPLLLIVGSQRPKTGPTLLASRRGKLIHTYSSIRKGLWHFLRGSWQIKSSIRYIFQLKKIMHIKLCPILTHRPWNKRTSILSKQQNRYQSHRKQKPDKQKSHT